MIGTSIAHFNITAKLGEGGMGEVYRATDTKLDREVAIKVLPDAFTSDPERLARFEREAKLLASLNHPNIGSIYGLEEADGVQALVLELIEGPTLADRIAEGPIPLDEALPIARQIGEALEAAHERGIIHRDLKPANVKVKVDGTVKVLDFGLAKAFQPEQSDPNLTQSPTLTAGATQLGVILGTAAYMSPEQARGRPVDKRADVWAFGAVLYECLTGKRAFEGEDVSDTLASILAREPSWEALPQNTPWRIRELLGDCLQKDSHDRPHDSSHARIQIKKALMEPVEDSPIGGTSTLQPPLWRKAIPWGITAVVTVALILVVLYFRAGAEPSQVVHSSVLPPEDTRFDSTAGPMALSPDGQFLAFVARTPEEKRVLWVRPLGSGSARPLPGTEDAFAPFWSPDSHFLGFFADGKLKKIEVSGGSLETLDSSVTMGFGGTWNQDGVILFTPGRGAGIQRVSSSGEGATPVTSPSESSNEVMHMWPFFLPDGNHFLYVARSPSSDQISQVYVSSLDGMIPTPLFSANSNVIYAAPGYLLFWREGTLRAQRFDVERLQIMGETLSVATGVRFDALMFSGLFSASQNGLLTYRAGTQARLSQLVWFDRAGLRLDSVGEPGNYYFPRLSHSGRQVAVDVSDLQNNGDLWLYDLSRPVPSRFTFDPANDTNPVWSPDDSRIVFSSARRSGLSDLYQKPTGSEGDIEALHFNEGRSEPTDWSRDGNFIAMNQGYPQLNSDLWVFSTQDQESTPFMVTPFRESDGRFSPDGNWMAYVSDESGQPEIYVQPFPGPGGKSRVSTSGGSMPSWSHDGRELFFIALNKSLMRAAIKLKPELEIEVPQPLFVTQIKHSIEYPQQYDVSPDGQRFLINTLLEEDDTASITLVLNWSEELKQLVSTN